MNSATVLHTPTETALEATIINIRPGRLMLVPITPNEPDTLPIDAAVEIIVGDELWLAEVIGQSWHGERSGWVADVRYRLPRKREAGRLKPAYIAPVDIAEEIADPAPEECALAFAGR